LPENNSKQSGQSSLEGVLERITFYNEENGFLIGKLREKEKRVKLRLLEKHRKFNVEKL